jgi:hypothetical protein
MLQGFIVGVVVASILVLSMRIKNRFINSSTGQQHNADKQLDPK